MRKYDYFSKAINVTYFIFLLGLFVLACSCTSYKASRVGSSSGQAAYSGIPDTASDATRGATQTAISGGKVLESARDGAAFGAADTAGSAVGAAIGELLK